jgi:amino acid transporter
MCPKQYNGWNNATYSTGELRNPRRNVPLAVVISTLIVTVIYVWTNIAYFATLPVDIVKTSSVTALVSTCMGIKFILYYKLFY